MPRKVFELAKELDMAPLDLVEALKAKGVVVRNHMTELSDADVEAYLAAVKKDEVKEDATAKKKVVRKKVAASASTPVAKKTVEKKAAAPADNSEVEKKITKKASTVKKKATVIRRKTDEDEAEENENDMHLSDDDEVDETSYSAPVEDEDDDVDSSPDIETAAPEAQEASGGLRVVSKPVKKDTPNESGVITRKAADKEAIAAEKAEERKQASQVDRPHRFTPVYTPSKDPLFKENQ
ncbi:MAG: translation initiation factor IF-2 N-terminal domain-containing protein, partial [Bacteriovorax sp.]|nr:translation initiation factor IF-2 N-terminal domain-containing protein [Bacteriovorax sp.]